MTVYVVTNDDHSLKHGYSEISGVALSAEEAEVIRKNAKCKFSRIISFTDDKRENDHA